MLFMMMRGICIAEAAPEAETPQQEPSVPVTEEPATSIPKPAPVADGEHWHEKACFVRQ